MLTAPAVPTPRQRLTPLSTSALRDLHTGAKTFPIPPRLGHELALARNVSPEAAHPGCCSHLKWFTEGGLGVFSRGHIADMVQMLIKVSGRVWRQLLAQLRALLGGELFETLDRCPILKRFDRCPMNLHTRSVFQKKFWKSTVDLYYATCVF